MMINSQELSQHSADCVNPSGQPNVRMRRVGRILVVFGALSPAFGFVMTLYGMARTFSIMARSQSSVEPIDLANGISIALVSTIVGIVVALVLLPVGISLIYAARRSGR
jgi:biopolymer transport protein ExbB/TolQ